MVVSSKGIAYVGNFGFGMDDKVRDNGWKWVNEHATDHDMLGVIIRVDPVGLFGGRIDEAPLSPVLTTS